MLLLGLRPIQVTLTSRPTVQLIMFTKSLLWFIPLSLLVGIVSWIMYAGNPNSSEDSVAGSEQAVNDDSWKTARTIYEFTAKDINNKSVSLEKYRGHPCIIVNVACFCGFATTNYKHLEHLYEKYSEKEGLRILGFPCNQFNGQEPGTPEEIKEFIKQFHVKFDMFAKINVNGNNAHPLFKFLKSKQGGTLGDFIKWNFTKFLVDKNGIPIGRYAPNLDPLKMEKDLEKCFHKKVEK